MGKLKLEDDFMTILVKMSDGNPGAMVALGEMSKKKDWFGTGEAGSIITIMHLDDMDIYGSKLYMLWNDCCNKDLEQFELVMRNYQMGQLSLETIHANLNQGRGTPFENLKTLEELFPN